MRNSIIAFGIACIALVACGGGGNTTPSAATSSSTSAGAPSGGPVGQTSSAGKASITITFTIPPKGTSTAALRRSPQFISPNTTQVNAYFTPTGGGSFASNSAACTPPTCSLSVFVLPGTYSVLVTAADGNGPLSAGTATGFTVALGAANTLTLAGPLVEVLNQVQLAPVPAIPVTVYNGQVTSSTVTVNLLDVDGNVVSQPPPYSDGNGTIITGLAVGPNSPSGTSMTINAGNAQVPITATGQTLNVSYNGTEPLSCCTSAVVNITSATSTGNVPQAVISSTVSSPFHLTQVAPVAFNPLTGANTGDPSITTQDSFGQAMIEYPLFISQIQQLTLTDNDTSPNFPITIDPGSCVSNSYMTGPSIYAAGNQYAGSPFSLGTYAGPIALQWTIQPLNAGFCTISVSDSLGNTYPVSLYFDQNSLYVSAQKRKK